MTSLLEDLVTDIGTIETVGKKNATHLASNKVLNGRFRLHESFINYAALGSQTPLQTKTKANDLLNAGMIGNVYGVEIVTSANVLNAASGNTDTYVIFDQAKSGMFIDKLPTQVKQIFLPSAGYELVARKRTMVGVLYPDGIVGRTNCLA